MPAWRCLSKERQVDGGGVARCDDLRSREPVELHAALSRESESSIPWIARSHDAQPLSLLFRCRGDNLQYNQHRLRLIWDDPKTRIGPDELDDVDTPARCRAGYVGLLRLNGNGKRSDDVRTFWSRVHLSGRLAGGDVSNVPEPGHSVHGRRLNDRGVRPQQEIVREYRAVRSSRVRLPRHRTTGRHRAELGPANVNGHQFGGSASVDRPRSGKSFPGPVCHRELVNRLGRRVPAVPLDWRGRVEHRAIGSR